ncbi:hypothetical protein DPMN_000593 [Dreissena polymorpha]|uniref:Uncharacterized protein n=1 Tax=Dreissena polymorpha TaxID=45954 RepID=A0A9D4MHN4_DREPO|nr:hypothetical protein DPMN_000593 [Dreissena polymorpha]
MKNKFIVQNNDVNESIARILDAYSSTQDELDMHVDTECDWALSIVGSSSFTSYHNHSDEMVVFIYYLPVTETHT